MNYNRCRLRLPHYCQANQWFPDGLHKYAAIDGPICCRLSSSVLMVGFTNSTQFGVFEFDGALGCLHHENLRAPDLG